MNYFELFDIPVSLTVDKKILNKKYVELQRKYHPDFYSQATDDEKAEALNQSSIINKALKVLQNKDEIIKYVLKEKGLLEEEEKFNLPPDFLMEMMELNEALIEEETAAFKEKISNLEIELYATVKGIVEGYQETKTTENELLQVKEYYYKKKYLQRILDRING